MDTITGLKLSNYMITFTVRVRCTYVSKLTEFAGLKLTNYNMNKLSSIKVDPYQ